MPAETINLIVTQDYLYTKEYNLLVLLQGHYRVWDPRVNDRML